MAQERCATALTDVDTALKALWNRAWEEERVACAGTLWTAPSDDRCRVTTHIRATATRARCTVLILRQVMLELVYSVEIAAQLEVAELTSGRAEIAQRLAISERQLDQIMRLLMRFEGLTTAGSLPA